VEAQKGREYSRLSRGTAGHGLFVVAAIFFLRKSNGWNLKVTLLERNIIFPILILFGFSRSKV